MTVSVRPWPEISADLRGRNGTAPLSIQGEAAVAGDALAAEVARLRASLSGNELAQKLIAVMDDEVGKPTGQPVTEFLQLLLTENAELDRLAAVVAAVHTALDHHDWTIDSAVRCVSAIAKAVER